MKQDDRPLDDESLASLIKQEIRYSIGGSTKGDDSELNQSWQKALDYYYAKPRGDEVAGRSKVISTDLADMIEQTLAQILPAFDKVDLCTFEGPDSRQMRIESDAVNYTVLQKNPGYIIFMEAIKDALLQRNGIIKVWVEEFDDISYEEHENVPEMSLLEIIGQDGEVTEHEVVQEEVLPEYDEFTGMNYPGQPAVYNITVKRTTSKKELKIHTVEPEEFSVNQDHNSIFLQDARFVRHTRIMTQSELIAQGFDYEIVKDLKSYTLDVSESGTARSRDSKEDEHDTAHESNRNIMVDECYYLIDYDNDKIAERRKILYADGQILSNDWFPCVPFSSGSPYIMPHRFWGLGFYDKLKQTVDIKTAFLRKTIDNAEGLINQRVIVRTRGVNMDDILSSRPNGVVRAKNPMEDVVPFPVQNLGDTGFTMLSYMDKIRKEAAGSQLEIGTSENTPVAGQTAHGMERWMTSKEHLPAMFVNAFADTLVKGVYQLTHKLMKHYIPETLQYQVNGEFAQTSPKDWQYGDNVKITVDTSETQKQKEYQALDMVLQQQIQALEKGTSLAQEANIYNTLIKQAKIAGLSNPGDHWIDPMSQQGQQLAQMNAQKAQQMQEAQQAETDKLYQTQVEISRMQESSDHMKAQLDFMIKQNEQLRKWVELELDYKTDIKGQGQDNGRVVNG